MMILVAVLSDADSVNVKKVPQQLWDKVQALSPSVHTWNMFQELYDKAAMGGDEEAEKLLEEFEACETLELQSKLIKY